MLARGLSGRAVSECTPTARATVAFAWAAVVLSGSAALAGRAGCQAPPSAKVRVHGFNG